MRVLLAASAAILSLSVTPAFAQLALGANVAADATGGPINGATGSVSGSFGGDPAVQGGVGPADGQVYGSPFGPRQFGL